MTLDDERRFCGHREVRNYLEAFAQAFRLAPLVRLNTKVLIARPLPSVDTSTALGPSWQVSRQWPLGAVALTTPPARCARRWQSNRCLLVASHLIPPLARVERSNVFLTKEAAQHWRLTDLG